MTPARKAFFATTYLPKKGNDKGFGLIDLLSEMARQWKETPERLIQSSEKITYHVLANKEKYSPGTPPNKGIALMGKGMLRQYYDDGFGGFGDPPKFPVPHNIMFCLRIALFENDDQALQMVRETLEQMYRGGIYDHVGGGFCRYSTDRQWLVPHFEKMLYDNALLVMAYLEAYQLTQIDLFKRVAISTMDYILREMTSPAGGFYSAQDSDANGTEGLFYVFTPDEITEALGEKDAKVFCEYFDITQEGNIGGKNIPNLLKNDRFHEDNKQISDMLGKVYEYRKQRYDIFTDEMILTARNSLMIAAYAKAYQILGDEKYLTAAKNAQEFIAANLMDENGRLMVRYIDGEAKGLGYIDDYGFYGMALIELYHATFDPKYLIEAEKVENLACELFFDYENGGFFFCSNDAEHMIIRSKELYDAVTPSGNSAATYVMQRLAALTGNQKWIDFTDKQLHFMSGNIPLYVSGFCFAMIPLMYDVYPSKELVCVSDNGSDVAIIKDLFKQKFMGSTAVLFKCPENADELAKVAPFTKSFPIPKDGMKYYLCQNRACHSPESNLERIISRI